MLETYVAGDQWTCLVAMQLQGMLAMGSLNLQRQYLFSWLNSHFRKCRTSHEKHQLELFCLQRNIQASGEIVFNFSQFHPSHSPTNKNNNNNAVWMLCFVSPKMGLSGIVFAFKVCWTLVSVQTCNYVQAKEYSLFCCNYRAMFNKNVWVCHVCKC